MKISLSILLLVGLLTSPLFAKDIPPKPKRLVNDYAQTLTSSELSQLERKLVSYNDKTGTQIAVVTIASLDGDDLFDYSQRLAESWGIGGGENDNGILLLIALKEKKIRIHTGYGTEGAVPDAIARRIIENELKPEFRAGDYYKGYDLATTAMMDALAGEYTATPRTKKRGFRWSYVIFIIIFIIFSIFGRRRRYTGYGNSGRRYYGTPWIGGGFGGGSSGGFGGGGGFGGFGGGGFGGGGASGGW